MAGAARDFPVVMPGTRAGWRAWLAAHHTSAGSVWVAIPKKGSGLPPLPVEDVRDEALCFGFVDSAVRKLDERHSLLLVSPRRPGSGWSKVNKDAIARLEAAGLMTPAGRAKIDAAVADGSWTKLDAVDALEVPADLAAALGAHAGAAARFDAFPRSAKRGILEWIAQAKRPETRAARIAETAAKAALGERANQWRDKGAR